MLEVIDQIRASLAAYQPREVAPEGRRPAAVLIPLYEHRDDLHVVFTRRADNLEHHSGQISFPGGSTEPEDDGPAGTALRESWEEIGIAPDHVELLGRVDDLVTGTGFHITPFVGLLDRAFSPYPWRPVEAEVAEIIEVPLRHLLDPANRELVVREVRDGTVLREAYRFGAHVIWGATASMLTNFLALIDHYSCPGLKTEA